MKKLIAINGGPRKGWNTDILLNKVMEGAVAAGAQAEMVHLYDLNFKGCVSCFACKRKGGAHGVCAYKDELSPVLSALHDADAMVFGAPIYLGNVTAEMRAFLERFIFSNMLYNAERAQFLPPNKKAAFVYTMNVPEDRFIAVGYPSALSYAEGAIERVVGNIELLHSFDTLQFSDYSQYEANNFDPIAKKQRHDTVFPEDCEKAFALGQRLVAQE